jgi:hypothetical protein
MAKRLKQLKYAKMLTNGGTWPPINKIILSSLACASQVLSIRPLLAPSAQQIAAAKRRAFVTEFQKAYTSKAYSQENC